MKTMLDIRMNEITEQLEPKSVIALEVSDTLCVTQVIAPEIPERTIYLNDMNEFRELYSYYPKVRIECYFNAYGRIEVMDKPYLSLAQKRLFSAVLKSVHYKFDTKILLYILFILFIIGINLLNIFLIERRLYL